MEGNPSVVLNVLPISISIGWFSAVPHLAAFGCLPRVFTLPGQLAPLALQNMSEIYGLLFRASAETAVDSGP
jgi:hypothetical protein